MVCSVSRHTKTSDTKNSKQVEKMPKNIQLLKQVRNVTTNLSNTIDNPDTKLLLSIADLFLNELMQQEQAGFYLDFLAKGKALKSRVSKRSTMRFPYSMRPCLPS
jgi:hypothetical protein